MGQNSSVQESAEAIIKELTKKSLPLYMCFIVHKEFANNKYLLGDIINAVNNIEKKYANPKNLFAILLEEEIGSYKQISQIDFCDAKSFYNKLNQHNWEKRHNYMQASEVYEKGLELNWMNGTKVLIDLSTANNRDVVKNRLINNYQIQVIDFNSQNDIFDLAKYIGSMESIKVDERASKQQLVKRSLNDNYEFKHFEADVWEIQSESQKLNKEYLKSFQGQFRYDELYGYRAIVELDNMPFNTDGNEVYCFRGKISRKDPNTGKKITEQKVFKLAKYHEIELERNFAAQNIARFLAEEFSNAL